MHRRSTLSAAAQTLRAAALLFAVAAFASLGQAKQWGEGYFPNLTVIDQDGRELRFYDDVIKGKIVVVSFFFTRCKSICPLATARLAELADSLGDKLGRDIFFVSLSVDPEHDNQAALKTYADTFHPGPGWLFLGGKREDIKAINAQFGEQMRSLADHRNEVILGNDRTGEWARDSVFGDLTHLAFDVQSMDPEWRPPIATGTGGAGSQSYALVNQPGQVLFKKLCASCHTFKVGKTIGPDLYGVTERRSRDWLERFIASPQAVRAAHDPTALALMQQFPTVRMPELGLSKLDAGDLVTYLDERTKALAQQANADEQAMQGQTAGDAHSE